MIIKIKIDEEEKESKTKREGKTTILELPVKMEVAKDSFLHIGAAASPLAEKDAAVFKVGRTPVIPATSFKGAMRHQLELLFIEKIDEFAELFNVENKEIMKPCIPSQQPTKAEEELISSGRYRKKAKLKNKEIVGCQISVDNENVLIPEIGGKKLAFVPYVTSWGLQDSWDS